MFLLKDLKMIRILGEGSFAKVYLVSFAGLGESNMKKLYALKVMSKAQVIKSNQLTHVYNEKLVMHAIRSPFFVRLYSTFQDERHLFMVMEYVPGGELFAHMRDVAKFTISQAKFYIAEILVALEAMHSQGIVYRDLKPENILLDSSGHIKLADFGFSKRVFDSMTWTLCGTPEYLAPEIITNIGHGFEVDFWSLGVIFYEMVVGVPPFYHENQVELCRQIIHGQIGFPPFLDAITRDLIKKLLTGDREKRLGYGQGAKMICMHPFFRDINWKKMQKQMYTPPIIPVKSSEDAHPDSSCSMRTHILTTTVEPTIMDPVFDQY
ncbi:protein kinase X [Nematocida displodere]|uniref:cAMP-dependent protein kinase n=1 Tax=Nematocida displodere TaxID=1805483 RepID=A0A177EJP5_9MICR|nr:protein kinase X [Nematocida displodere]